MIVNKSGERPKWFSTRLQYDSHDAGKDVFYDFLQMRLVAVVCSKNHVYLLLTGEEFQP